MKVIIASTSEQEEKIVALVNRLKKDLLPRFFGRKELEKMYESGILDITEEHFEQFGNLRDAFQVITSLQTIAAILETKNPDRLPMTYQEMFEKNTMILQEFGIQFPFFFSHFTNKRNVASLWEHEAPVHTYLM